MRKINAVVIDDEISNRDLIIKLISESNLDFDIKGEADSADRAYDLINKIRPEIVFLDIKMPGGSGFALLDRFVEIYFEVVFISGFNNYALKAFEFNALDYVLKPIDPEKFRKTLCKVRSNIEKKSIQPEMLKSIIQSYDLNQMIITKIPIHAGNKVQLLAVEDIIYIKSEAGCTLFKTNSNENLISSKQLSDFEFILDNLPFLIRVRKGTFINLNFISSYSKGMTCFLTMKEGTVFEISRRKKGEILELLHGINKSK